MDKFLCGVTVGSFIQLVITYVLFCIAERRETEEIKWGGSD